MYNKKVLNRTIAILSCVLDFFWSEKRQNFHYNF